MGSRYELKFLITAEQKRSFLKAARPWIIVDPLGRKGVYRVTSQYFDSSDLECYWEKLDGVAIRKKIRLRFYEKPEAEGFEVGASFLEVKHRINNTIYKERVQLSEPGAEGILTQEQSLLDVVESVVPQESLASATINTILQAATRSHYVASVVISYLREAWIGKVDQRLRVTFDSFCRADRPVRYLDVEDSDGHIMLPGKVCVMELKFNHAVPRWARDICASQGLQLRRYSKYAAGIEALCRQGSSQGELPVSSDSVLPGNPCSE